MKITREQMEAKLSVWTVVPEDVKTKLYRFQDVVVREYHTEILFEDAKGRLLYRIEVQNIA